MPKARVNGIQLYYEEVGQGRPSCSSTSSPATSQSWRLQVSFFCRRYRTIAYNARGYPPSDVPDDVEAYSQQQAADDIRGLLDALGIARAHICGLSMGGYATLHFGLSYPQRALSLVVAGAGYGSGDREKPTPRLGGGRQALRGRAWRGASSTPRAPPACSSWRRIPWAGRSSATSSPRAPCAGTRSPCRACQMQRPSVFDLGDRMARLEVPTLIVTGDEDDPCLEPGIFMKRTIPTRAGGDAQGRPRDQPRGPRRLQPAVLDFLTAVDSGRWTRRNPASMTGSAILPAGAKSLSA